MSEMQANTGVAGGNRKSVEPYLRDDVEFRNMQVAGVRVLAKARTGAILADDMGLGKTLQMLACISTLFLMRREQTALIVAPASLKGNWLEEFQKFTRMTPTVLGLDARGRTVSPDKISVQLFGWILSARENAKKYAESGDPADFKPSCLVAHYEQLSSKTLVNPIRDFKFGVLVLDEAHLVKNPESKRTSAVLSITSNRTYSLTGTPMPNHAGELFTHLHRIDPTRFSDYSIFLNHFCKQVPSGGIRTKNESELRDALGDIMLRRRKVDLGMEEPIIIQDKSDLVPAQRALYDHIVEGGELDGREVPNAMARFGRLRQVISTPACLRMGYADESGKLDRAIMRATELLNNNKKVVIFSEYQETIQCLNRRLRLLGAKPFLLNNEVHINDRQALTNMWAKATAPEPIICSVKIGGTGHNMVAASSLIIIDRLFVPGLNTQMIDRCNRIGQTEQVTVYIQMARNTVEARIQAILARKISDNDALVEQGADKGYVRQILRAAVAEEFQMAASQVSGVIPGLHGESL